MLVVSVEVDMLSTMASYSRITKLLIEINSRVVLEIVGGMKIILVIIIK